MSNLPENLYWIGPRKSDLDSIEGEFKGAIVIVGEESKSKNFLTVSMESKTKIRLNHNDDANYYKIVQFYNEEISKIIVRDPHALFLWYSRFPVGVSDEIIQRSPFNNSTQLYNLISDKLKMRLLISSQGMKVVAGAQAGMSHHLSLVQNCKYELLIKKFPSFDSFVIQEITGSGGFSTFLITSKEDNHLLENITGHICMLSGYLKSATSINVHILVDKGKTVSLPPSIQILDEKDGRLFYAGGDFASANDVGKADLEKISNSAVEIGDLIRKVGYRGVAGIDFLLTNDGELYFVEINPRFQGSTPILNQALSGNKKLSMQHMNIQCFRNESVPSVFNMKINKSFYAPVVTNVVENKRVENDSEVRKLKTPDSRESPFNKTSFTMKMVSDGASSLKAFEYGSQFVRYIFDRRISGYDRVLGKYTIFPSIKRLSSCRKGKYDNLSRENISLLAMLKFELICYGAQIAKDTIWRLSSMDRVLTYRDGVAGGLNIKILEDIYINIPIKEYFSLISPFRIDYLKHAGYALFCEDKYVCNVEILSRPSFIDKKSQNDTVFQKVGQLFTDRLGVAPFKGCIYNQSGGCEFCEIGVHSKISKTNLADIYDLVKFCEHNETDRFKHVLISGGTPPPGEWNYLCESVATIRRATRKSIYIMLTPTSKNKLLELRVAGVNEIGMNIEIFDSQFAKKFMRGKGNISRENYFKSLGEAVELWGSEGQVRSLLIVGLESKDSTLKGVKKLVERGVMPILSPFVPINGTALENYPPPTPELIYNVWSEAQDITEKGGMTLGPLCIECQNNTATLPINSLYKEY